MDGKDSSAAVWTLPPDTCAKLEAMLLAGTTAPRRPDITADTALVMLEDMGAYAWKHWRRRDDKRTSVGAPTPSLSRDVIENLLGHIKRFEAFADEDTRAAVAPHLSLLRKGLEERRDVLVAWEDARIARSDPKWTLDNGDPIRKADARTERLRVLCGYVWRIWQNVSRDPDNVRAWRNFTITFLIAAECWSADDRHPERIDEWRLTPVEPMTPELNAAAAEDARAVIEELAPK